jgi:photosystem II stability/assembly factor-like uncharacterized protein
VSCGRAVAALALVCGACDPSDVTCSSDAFCARGDARGVCAPSPASSARFCAFSDASCGSGLRWDATAGDGLSALCLTAGDGGLPSDGGLTSDLSLADGASPEMAHPLAWSTEQSGVTDLLEDVWGSSPTDLYVVSQGGAILHSVDDGKSWTAQTSGTTALLRSVRGWAATGDVLAVGGAGTVLHTSNNGAKWTAQNSGTTQDLFGVCVRGTDQWAVGIAGVAIHSTNFGATWTPAPTGQSFQLLDCVIRSPNDVFAVGLSSSVLHWDGNQWATLPSGTTVAAIHRIRISGTGSLLAAADAGVISSSNGGATWSAPVAVGAAPIGLAVASATDLVCGQAGFVARSVNGGTQWATDTTGTTNALQNIFALSDDEQFAVGASGTILHYH